MNFAINTSQQQSTLEMLNVRWRRSNNIYQKALAAMHLYLHFKKTKRDRKKTNCNREPEFNHCWWFNTVAVYEHKESKKRWKKKKHSVHPANSPILA